MYWFTAVSSKMPCHITDGPRYDDCKPVVDEDDEHERLRQRDIDEAALHSPKNKLNFPQHN